MTSPRSGFTIVETLVVISLMGLLASGAVFSMRAAQDRVALNEGQAIVLYALETARSRAISGYGDTNHGVRVTSNHATLFAGNAYGGSGQEYYLPVTLAIAPAGVDVVFTRLSGAADADHAFTISSPAGDTLTITVSAHGTIESE